ncbi:13030_t:CDS:1 [Ambispora leptoticha]|uniref:13030_t:CDS:1 n=1 Tax=Ambispora leptoticha TaxID=144679 RepID=A0A9N8WQW1_9GLOM|nr:13030_t:CDS:1 [Ambispora leptoticha]
MKNLLLARLMIIFVLYINFAFSAPYEYGFERQVAWCEMKKDVSKPVSGFFVLSQIQTASPKIILYGAWETGFDDPDPNAYSFIITPANYNLTEKLKVVPREGGATDPWSIMLHDVSLSSLTAHKDDTYFDKGVSLAGEQQFFQVLYKDSVIGSGPIVIL